MLLVLVICFDKQWCFVPLRRPTGCKLAYLQQVSYAVVVAQGRHQAARAILKDSTSKLPAQKPGLSSSTLASLCGEKDDPCSLLVWVSCTSGLKGMIGHLPH